MSHLFGVIDGTIINTNEELRPIMYKVCDTLRLTVVNEAFHQFEPHGTTGVLVLSESHFSAHTYPESSKIYLDLFCCSKDFKPDKAADVIEGLFEGKFTWSYVKRF
jgi:S-adenosylmethionine decarboxylase